MRILCECKSYANANANAPEIYHSFHHRKEQDVIDAHGYPSSINKGSSSNKPVTIQQEEEQEQESLTISDEEEDADKARVRAVEYMKRRSCKGDNRVDTGHVLKDRT
eukprot:464834_1